MIISFSRLQLNNMKKNHLKILSNVCFIFSLVFHCVSIKAANSGKNYIKGELGIVFPTTKVESGSEEEKLQNSIPYGVTFGYRFTNRTALDVEFLDFGKLKLDSKNPISMKFLVSSASNRRGFLTEEKPANLNEYYIKPKLFMANLRCPFYSSTLSYYVTVGLGLAHVESSDYIITAIDDPSLYYKIGGATKQNLAYSAGLGLSLPLNDALNLDLEYRYISLGEPQNRSRTYNHQGKILDLSDKYFKILKLNTHFLSLGISYTLPDLHLNKGHKANVDRVNVDKPNIGKVSVDKTNVGKVNVSKTSVGEVNVGKRGVGKADVGKVSVDKANVDRVNTDKINVDRVNVDRVNVDKVNTGKVNSDKRDFSQEKVNKQKPVSDNERSPSQQKSKVDKQESVNSNERSLSQQKSKVNRQESVNSNERSLSQQKSKVNRQESVNSNERSLSQQKSKVDKQESVIDNKGDLPLLH